MASELTSIYALIELDELREAGLPYTQFCPVIKLKPFDLLELKDVLKYAFLEDLKSSFCICLKIDSPAEEKDSEQWFNSLAILLAHPGYSKIGNDKIIVFSSSDHVASGNEHFRSALITAIRRHGFRYVRVISLFDSHRLLDSSQGLFFVSKNMMKNWSTALQSFQEYFINTIVPPLFFIEYYPGAIQWAMNLHKEAKHAMLLSNAATFTMAAERHQIRLRFYRVLQEKTLIQDDLMSANTYLDFLLAKSREMNESDEFEFSNLVKLKKFYYYEYEILPLWYKRFGHVIKVIMGKRTLKSLFNSNVTKYKL
jgi:hypothetical protein